jgi:DNA polymerase III delta prime subunit
MAIIEVIVDALVGKLAEKATSAVTKGSAERPDHADPLEVAPHLRAHLLELANWSEKVRILGMTKAGSTDEDTIGLEIGTEPRRFRGGAGRAGIVDELALIRDDRHYLMLGEPGAGKTTTIKRLIRHLLTEEPEGDDGFQYPVLLLLREVAPEKPVYVALADALGVSYEVTRVEYTGPAGIVEWRLEYKRGSTPLHYVMSDLFNTTHPVILLDGLDEVPAWTRHERQQQIERLVRGLSGAKVLVSCRSGDYDRHFEGLDVVELESLDDERIHTIAAKRLGSDADAFIAVFADLPYRDVADRPLLLMQLILHFERFGYLPEQPAEIYQRIVQLLLEGWDADRYIRRESKYAGFTPPRKAQFLSAIAYHLTYVTHATAFDSRMLQSAYLAVYERFRLPREQAALVVAEIQTHTGLIVQTRDGVYEFSHLSLQEYLCASYLVNDPVDESVRQYVVDYPAPIAVAVALASDPSRWFAALILKWCRLLGAGSARSLLSRLLIEKPFFSTSWILGTAVMMLYLKFRSESGVTALIDRLLREPFVASSVREALNHYDLVHSDAWGYNFAARLPMPTELGMYAPANVALPAKAFAYVMKSSEIRTRANRRKRKR